jgi:hypothetical protein
MSDFFREAIAQRIRSAGLVAVVILRELEIAVPLARALRPQAIHPRRLRSLHLGGNLRPRRSG